MSESLDRSPTPSALRDGVRGALVFVVAAPFTAAVVAAAVSGVLSLRDGPPEGELAVLLGPVLVFAGALLPAVLAGFVTGAGATRAGPGVRLYLLAAAAGALATLCVHAARFLPDLARLGAVALLAVPPSLAAAWFGAQVGMIGPSDDR